MADYKDILFSKAFKIIPGLEYNKTAYELRAKEGTPFVIYEVIIKEEGSWPYLRDKVYPNLARYLKEKGLDLTSGEGLIIALFYKDHVYFIKGMDFIKAFCEIEGLNLAAFHFRVLSWLNK